MDSAGDAGKVSRVVECQRSVKCGDLVKEQEASVEVKQPINDSATIVTMAIVAQRFNRLLLLLQNGKNAARQQMTAEGSGRRDHV